MSKFENIFIRMLEEDMTAGTAFSGGNTVGQTAGGLQNVDSYAPGDARIPKSLGTVEVRRDKKKKKKKSKKVKLKKEQPKVPGETFPFYQTRQSGMTGTGNKDGFSFM
jgi:hypothetical protein